MTKFLRLIFTSAIIVWGLSGCVPDLEALRKTTLAEWNPDLAVPLVDDTLALNQIATNSSESGNLQINPGRDNYYFLQFQGFSKSQTLGELIQIPDQILPAISIPTGSAAFPVLAVLAKDSTLPFSVGEGRSINFMRIREGKLFINVRNDLRQDIKLSLVFKDIINAANGDTLQRKQIPVLARTTYSDELVLNNHDLNLIRSSGVDSNNIRVAVRAEIMGPVQGLPVRTDEGVFCSFLMQEMKFNYLEGNFSNFILEDKEESVKLSTFSRTLFNKDNRVYFDDPKIVGRFRTSIGTRLQFNMTNFTTEAGGGVSRRLTGPGIDALDPLIMNGATKINPTVVGPTPLRTDTAYQLIDKNNTNIVSGDFFGFFESSPDRMLFKVKALALANGSRQFGFDTSSIRINTQIILPLNGRATQLGIQDTFKVSFPVNDPQYQYIDSIQIRTVMTNGFPFLLDGQFYFVSNSGEYIDSLITSPNRRLSDEAQIDNDGKVIPGTAPRVSRIFKIKADRYARIQRLTDIIVFRGFMKTTNAEFNRNMKIYPEYKIRLQMGVQVRAKLKFE